MQTKNDISPGVFKESSRSSKIDFINSGILRRDCDVPPLIQVILSLTPYPNKNVLRQYSDDDDDNADDFMFRSGATKRT